MNLEYGQEVKIEHSQAAPLKMLITFIGYTVKFVIQKLSNFKLTTAFHKKIAVDLQSVE